MACLVYSSMLPAGSNCASLRSSCLNILLLLKLSVQTHCRLLKIILSDGSLMVLAGISFSAEHSSMSLGETLDIRCHDFWAM